MTRITGLMFGKMLVARNGLWRQKCYVFGFGKWSMVFIKETKR